MTTPTDAQWLAMSKAVQSIIQRPDAEPFRAAVEWKALGLFDYPQIIKKPMDLGTVKGRITDRKYKSLQEACEDVRLVWKNCMEYNADGSDFYKLARNLSKRWEEKYSKVLTDLQLDVTGVGAAAVSLDGGDSTKISLDDKRAFAKSLYKINKDDLGKLIVEVDTKCPSALVKNSAEDECELNVDKLTPAIFHELKHFVSLCNKNTSSSSSGSKKKSSGGGSSSSKKQKTS